MNISPNATDSEDEELSNEELSRKIKSFCNLCMENVSYLIILVLLLFIIIVLLFLSRRLISAYLFLLSYLCFIQKQCKGSKCNVKM